MQPHLEMIREELLARMKRNPTYSQRAFARSLGVDSSSLNRVLNGQRVPGKLLTKKIIQDMGWAPEKKSLFFQSIQSMAFESLVDSKQQKSADAQTHELSESAFRVLSDWYYYAILELTFVRGFQSNPSWISRQLVISVVEVRRAVEEMSALGLISKNGAFWRKTKKNITSPDKSTTNSALKKRQKQVLHKAIESIENDPLEERNHSGITMAVDSARIPEAKKMILAFQRKLCTYLEGGTPDRVFEISTTLIPLQKKESKS